jgi:hypothetical protein
VVQPAGDAQGDAAAVVDAVVPDPVVGVGVAAGGGLGLGAGAVGGRGGGPVRQGPVRPAVVVGRGERVEQGLQLGEGGGLDGLGAQPLLEGLLEAFGLAAGGGVVGAGVLLRHAQAPGFGLEALRPPLPPARRVVKTMPLSVSVEAGVPKRAVAARKRPRTAGPVTGWWAVTSRA